MQAQRLRNKRKQETKVPNEWLSILDPVNCSFSSDDLEKPWNNVVEENLQNQFNAQFKEGYLHTIRRRFKACPYTIPSFPIDEAKEIEISHWNIRYLSKFVNERGMILPRRLTGMSIHGQRQLTKAIARAKYLKLMPRNHKWMFVDNKGLKHTDWIRQSTSERIKNTPPPDIDFSVSETQRKLEESFQFPTITRSEADEEIQRFGLGFDEFVDEGVPDDLRDIPERELKKMLKYDASLTLADTDDEELDENGQPQPRENACDVDALYKLHDDDPEVSLHTLSRKWKSYYRDNLTERFNKEYKQLSQYWKEEISKEIEPSP